MKHVTFTLFLLLATAAVHAENVSLEPASDEPLYFRMEVGARPGHVIAGWLDESGGTGKGYDFAVLDRDGDGTFETKETFGTQLNHVTKKQVPKPVVTVEHEGATWSLDLYSIGYRRPVAREGKVTTFLRWSVRKGDFYAWFINGRMEMTTDPGKAKTVKPVRLGPPFTFETGAATRGPQALARVGLKDANGATMRLAREGKVERRIEVVLTAGGKEVFRKPATYG